jgi:hypothetical protein
LRKKFRILKPNFSKLLLGFIVIIQGCTTPEYKIVNHQVVQIDEVEVIGVEGEMGSIMHQCLATNLTGPNTPLIVNGKDILTDKHSEHQDYFDCVDTEIMKSDQK